MSSLQPDQLLDSSPLIPFEEPEHERAEVNLSDLEGSWGELRVGVSATDMVLYFPFNEEANACLKQIEGVEYNGIDKSWSLPITDANQFQVRDAVATVREFLEQAQKKAEQQEARRHEMAEGVLQRLQHQFDYPGLSLDQAEGQILVSFPYSAKAVAIMRKIDGRSWDGDEKHWRLPADREKQIRNALRALGKVLR